MKHAIVALLAATLVIPPAALAQSHDDRVAQRILASYDAASHRVRTERVPIAEAPGEFRIRVRSTNGDELLTSPFDSEGAVIVATRSGDHWASAYELVWVVAGRQPGLCETEEGWIALLERAGAQHVVASARWTGTCGTERGEGRFIEAAGEHLILEPEGESGEQGPANAFLAVWRVDRERLVRAGRVRVGMHPGASGNQSTEMTATVEGTPAGIVVHESWSRASDAQHHVIRTSTHTFVIEHGVVVPRVHAVR